MFESREHAGEVLAKLLKSYRHAKDTLVVGIARGGVVVANVISQKLSLPLHVLVVKKIGAPGNAELAIGAIGPDKTLYWDRELIQKLSLSQKALKSLKLEKQKEQEEKEKELHIPKMDIVGKAILLVDDGVATGATVQVAQMYFKKKGAKEIILVTPVISKDVYSRMRQMFHDIIAPEIGSNFRAVGQFYQKFEQVSDKEVIQYMQKQ